MSAACCLPPHCRDGKLPVRTHRRAGAADLPAFQHKSISTAFLLPSQTAPKGNRNSGTAVLAHGSQTHVHTGYLCSPGQKIALPAPRMPLRRGAAAWCWGSGWEFGTRPRRAAAPGERAVPQDSGWMWFILPCTSVANGIRGGVREAAVRSLLPPG